MTEHDLVAGLVHFWFVMKVATFFRWIESPSGENFGHFGDIVLGVATVDAERVQFHQLAPVIFVEAAGRLFARLAVGTILWDRWIAAALLGDSDSRLRIGAHAEPVVEIEHHRRALRRRAQ